MTEQKTHPSSAPKLGAGLLATLALISSIGPFATDLHLAAFPQMMVELNTGTTGVQLTLTAFFMGLGFGQVFFGALSDRTGRRAPLLVGMALCLLASIACGLAPNIELLIAARFLQGFAGSAGPVIARAVVTDLVSGPPAARAFSLVVTVVGIAPVIAPLIGAFLLNVIGWRGLMWIVAGITAVMLMAVAIVVPESHTRARRAALRETRAVQGSPWRLLTGRVFIGNLLAFAFGFGALMSHISASPFVFQVMAGLDEHSYALVFASISGTMVICTWISARLTRRIETATILRIGLGALLVAASLVLVLTLTGVPAIWLWPVLAVALGSVGLTMGNATALALSSTRRAGGTASACLGAAQFALGAIVSPLVGAWGEHTTLPLALSMLICAIIAACGALFAQSGNRPRP